MDRNLNPKQHPTILLFFFDSASISSPQRHVLMFFLPGSSKRLKWGGQHDLFPALPENVPGSPHCPAGERPGAPEPADQHGELHQDTKVKGRTLGTPSRAPRLL